jgi:membrane-bound lytic murein transglycosylase
MNRFPIMAAIILLSLLSLNIGRLHADTLYSWTDADGVRRYSNATPPQGAKDVKIIETETSPQDSTPTADATHQRYEQMVDKARSESRQLEKDRQAEEAARAAEKRRRQKTERKRRIDNERRKLQAEIDAVKARGLSRTFSQGMKDNLIRKIKERLDSLEKDPETYFTHLEKGE